ASLAQLELAESLLVLQRRGETESLVQLDPGPQAETPRPQTIRTSGAGFGTEPRPKRVVEGFLERDPSLVGDPSKPGGQVGVDGHGRPHACIIARILRHQDAYPWGSRWTPERSSHDREGCRNL